MVFTKSFDCPIECIFLRNYILAAEKTYCGKTQRVIVVFYWEQKTKICGISNVEKEEKLIIIFVWMILHSLDLLHFWKHRLRFFFLKSLTVFW